MITPTYNPSAPLGGNHAESAVAARMSYRHAILALDRSSTLGEKHMPGPDFTEENAALKDAEANLRQARTEFIEGIAAQCEPNITAWAKDVFLSQPEAAATLSADAVRSLREGIKTLALEIAASIQKLAQTPGWPRPTDEPTTVPIATGTLPLAGNFPIERDLEDQSNQYLQKINQLFIDAGLSTPKEATPIGRLPQNAPTHPQPSPIAGRTIWPMLDDRPLRAAANDAITKRQNLERAEAKFIQQALGERWDEATPGDQTT